MRQGRTIEQEALLILQAALGTRPRWEKVSPREDVGCELTREALDQLASDGFAPLRAALIPLVEHYSAWIEQQQPLPGSTATSRAPTSTHRHTRLVTSTIWVSVSP